MRRVYVTAVLAVATLAGLLSGCTSPDGPAAAPTSSASSNPHREQFLQDKGIRPVRMASGRALTYVLPDTGMQILCQTLTKDRWERLLGGRVGRHPTGSCMINDERGLLFLELGMPADGFAGETTVAGRPATVEQNDVDGVSVTVALTDDVGAPATPRYHSSRPLLILRSSHHGSPRAELDLAMRLLEELVPVLAKDGEPIPSIGDVGQVSYVSTPLTPGDEFVDLPTPVQALQLCTVLIEGALVEVAPTNVALLDSGWCTISGEPGENFRVAVDRSFDQLSAYPDRIAGRPSRIIGNEVRVRLRDDVYADLSVTAPDAAALAEGLVSLLAG